MVIKKIAIARGTSANNSDWPSGVDFLPDDANRPVLLWEGRVGRERIGGQVSARVALDHSHSKKIIELGAAWFLPILEKIAKGEKLSIEEIQRAGASFSGKVPEIVYEEL